MKILIKVTDAEPRKNDPRKRYLVEATCDNCGILFLRHTTTRKPDNLNEEVYCRECQEMMLD